MDNTSSTGATIGIIIIVLMLIAGGVYFLLMPQNARPPVELPPIDETL